MSYEFVRRYGFASAFMFVLGLLPFHSSSLAIESVSGQDPDATLPSKTVTPAKPTSAAKPPTAKRKPAAVRPSPKATEQRKVGTVRAIDFDDSNSTMARVQEALDRGNKALESRQYWQAHTAFSEAIDLNSKESRAYFGLGNIYQDQSEYRKAIEQYEKATSAKPDYAEAYAEMGNSYYFLARIGEAPLSQAEKAYEKAAMLHPTLVSALVGQGQIYRVTGRLTLADEKFRAALTLRPDYAPAVTGLGDVFAAQNLNHEAVEKFQKAIQLKPDWAVAHNSLGIQYHSLKRYDEAIQQLQEAIRLAPKWAFPYYNLGNVYVAQEKNDAAIVEYSKASSLAPKWVAPYLVLANNVYYKNGDYELAAEQFKKALELDKTLADAWFKLGNIYLDKRRPAVVAGDGGDQEPEMAIECYQKSIEADATQARFYNGLGNAYYFYNVDHPDFRYVPPTPPPTNTGAVAKQIFVPKVTPRYPGGFQFGTKPLPSFIRDDWWHSWPKPTRPELFRFNPNEVIRQYQKAIDLDPRLAVAHNGLGNVYVELKRYDEAIARYLKAIELEPLWAYPQHGLGDVYFEQRRFQEALTYYQKSIALDPKLAQSYYQAGLTYLELKNKKDARTQHEKLLTLDRRLASELLSKF